MSGRSCDAFSISNKRMSSLVERYWKVNIRDDDVEVGTRAEGRTDSPTKWQGLATSKGVQ